jgi:hypothetical protein
MTRAHEEIIDFIASGTTSRSVLAFQPSLEAKSRVDTLLRKKGAGTLAPEDARELDEYLQLEHLMRLAKARAKKLTSRE